MSEWSRWRETHPVGPLLPLGFKLLFCVLLPNGFKWMWMLFRLVCFSILLMPAWISIAWFYLTSENIRRNVRYGTNSRNFLDIYYPNTVLSRGSCPVLIFFSGGAWIIGYKAWGALFSKILIEMGVIVVNPDYRNFPQGRIGEMLTDVDQAVEWVLKNIDQYGGDPKNVYIGGQSAGAHLALMTILRKAVAETKKVIDISNNDVVNDDKISVVKNEEYEKSKPTVTTSWRISQIKAFIGISGPYNIIKMKDHFHQRGLHRNIYTDIFTTEKNILEQAKSIAEISPTDFVGKYCNENTVLPRLYFFHGTKDESCPHQSTEQIVEQLVGAKVKAPIITKYYDNKSHTDLILEDLMHDDSVCEGDLVHDIAQILHEKALRGHVEFTNTTRPSTPRRRRPSFTSVSRDPLNEQPEHTTQTIIHRNLLYLARKINPF